LNYSDEATSAVWKDYFGFKCYELPKRSRFKHLTDINDVKNLVKLHGITAVIAYNYPAYALNKLIRFCRKNSLRCYADVTEWPVTQRGVVRVVARTLDTAWRMRILHKKMDGIIVISEFLFQYYRDTVRTVKIPPTVDLSDVKWTKKVESLTKTDITFIYAGSPSAQKECLDIIVQAIEDVRKKRDVSLKVVGITQRQYESIYSKKYTGTAVTFMGHMPHKDTILEITQADWSIIIRENNRVVQAGFPTKLAESIACGTPVLVNKFSNIDDYLDEDNSIHCEMNSVSDAIKRTCNVVMNVDRSRFDYRNYLDEIEELMT